MSQWIRIKVKIVDRFRLTEEAMQQLVEEYRRDLRLFGEVEDVEFEDWKPREEERDEARKGKDKTAVIR